MKKGIAILFLLISAACTANLNSTDVPPASYATPTNSELFTGEGGSRQIVEEGDLSTTRLPTVSDVFRPYTEITETVIAGGESESFNATPQVAEIAGTEVTTREIVIYDDTLDDNWQIISSENMTANPENTQFVSKGSKSIQITSSGEEFGSLYIVLNPGSTVTYTREEILGIEFELSGGSGIIETSDLGVTILGSNQYAYYVLDDTSVTNIYDPIFSETRLYYLGINHAIPADTWVTVTNWLDERQYDPIYEYVTGFSIKKDEVLLSSFYIDNIRLIVAADEPVASVATTAPDSTPTPGSPLDSITTVNVDIDTLADNHAISPLIYGITGAKLPTLDDLKPGLNSWGGDKSSRYNWLEGNAWNSGVDGNYQNTNDGYAKDIVPISDRFIEASTRVGALTRFTLPTLGWVARNSNPQTCSFPLSDGTCGNAEGASCLNPGEMADPRLANVTSDVETVLQWVRHLVIEKRYPVNIFALDNQPELWGVTHYDVHPTCTTYQEVLDKYLEYALPIKEMLPKVMLAGPVTSGWEYFWRWETPEGVESENPEEDFLPWFLTEVREHDEKAGVQTIDVLDVQYAPEDLANDVVDAETASLRTRAPRLLWDPEYVDETVGEPVALIPALNEVIDQNYPGLKLGLSSWNFGADTNINGALAIADVLGILGREDVYYAAYSTFPETGTPGAFAFKMFTNYDGWGSGFGDLSVQTISDEPDLIGAYAAINQSTRRLHLMIINKHPKNVIQVNVNIDNFKQPYKVVLYRYSRESLAAISTINANWPAEGEALEIPPYSISHYILYP